MFKSRIHRVVQLTSLMAILPHAFSAIGQCYSFTGASTTGVPAAIYLSLPNLQSPTVGTDPAGDTTFTYSLGGSGGNSVTVSGGGVTSTASGTAITPGAASQIVVTSGPALTAVQILVSSSTGDPYPFAATIGLSTPEGANLPVNFLPNGITDPLPPLSSWTQTGAFIDIGSPSPIVFDALVTSIGSNCGEPPPQCTIDALTLAHVPGTNDMNRALTGRVGVGENVKLSMASGESATWSITSDSGQLSSEVSAVASGTFYPNEGFPTLQCSGAASSSVSGPQACFTAPDKTSSVTVKALLGSGISCSIPLTVVQPQWMLFQRLHYPKGNPDYAFSYKLFDLGFDVTMETVAFVTPGDVSFANVLFKEKDSKMPSFKRRYNALFDLGTPSAANNAWLVGCDYDMTTQGERLFAEHSDAPFAFVVYQKGSKASDENDFSEVRTEWSIQNDTVRFSKRQLAALNGTGSIPTPGLLAATLKEPAVDFNDLVIIPDFATGNPIKGIPCLNIVTSEFTLKQ